MNVVRNRLPYRFIRDVQGSVRLVVDAATGTIAQRLDYDSFGTVLQDTNPGFQPFGFQSGLYHPDTALVQFGARWYDASTGRWLSKDPILLEGGLNLYVFCGNDPVNYVDPWGLAEGGMASDAYDFWGEVAVAGFDQGGFLGGAQAAGASFMQAVIDFWGARSIERNAGLSGMYSAQEGGMAKSVGYGALAVGQIGLAATTAFAGNNVAHPFYRYVGAGSKPIGKGAWVVRGTFGRAPYGRDFVKAAEKLQLPRQSMVDDVVRVPGAWKRYIAGPRRVSGNPQWGAGGGTEYRIGGF